MDALMDFILGLIRFIAYLYVAFKLFSCFREMISRHKRLESMISCLASESPTNRAITFFTFYGKFYSFIDLGSFWIIVGLSTII